MGDNACVCSLPKPIYFLNFTNLPYLIEVSLWISGVADRKQISPKQSSFIKKLNEFNDETIFVLFPFGGPLISCTNLEGNLLFFNLFGLSKYA